MLETLDRNLCKPHCEGKQNQPPQVLCYSLAELTGCFQPEEVPQHTGAGAGGLGFLWPQRGSVLGNERHLRFELCRQVQVPSAGKLAVLEIRAAEWLFAPGNIYGRCVGNNFRVIFKHVVVEARVQHGVFSLDF